MSTTTWHRPYRHPAITAIDEPVPVIHRDVVLGHAKTRAGALRIARRKLIRQMPEREDHNATLVDWYAEGWQPHGKAWAVGIHLAVA